MHEYLQFHRRSVVDCGNAKMEDFARVEKGRRGVGIVFFGSWTGLDTVLDCFSLK